MVVLQALQTFMDLHQQGKQAILQYNLQTGNWGQEEGWAKEMSTVYERPIWGNLALSLMLTLVL